MPFKSRAQAAYMFIHKPKLAREFAEKTANIKKLPEHVAKKRKEIAEKMIH